VEDGADRNVGRFVDGANGPTPLDVGNPKGHRPVVFRRATFMGAGFAWLPMHQAPGAARGPEDACLRFPFRGGGSMMGS